MEEQFIQNNNSTLAFRPSFLSPTWQSSLPSSRPLWPCLVRLCRRASMAPSTTTQPPVLLPASSLLLLPSPLLLCRVLLQRPAPRPRMLPTLSTVTAVLPSLLSTATGPTLARYIYICSYHRYLNPESNVYIDRVLLSCGLLTWMLTVMVSTTSAR